MEDHIHTAERDIQRLLALTGGILDESVDDELQDLVHRAAGELGTPIAMVSLILDRLQYFKAHVGLPEELAHARATDSNISFCQFVVREGAPFIVTDAINDERVPQELVVHHGVRAYLGVPVRARGEVVGSLCVVDMERRGFTDDQLDRLSKLAELVSHRLTELLGARRGQFMLSRATAPAFAELRNLLGPLQNLTAGARVSSFELGVLTRVTEVEGRPPPTMTDARSALRDLNEGLAMLEEVARRIEQQVLAIESIAQLGDASVTVAEVIEDALRLAHHHTKLVGGVRVESTPGTLRLSTARTVAVASLSTALSAVATAMGQQDEGLRLTAIEDEFTVVITIGTNLSQPQLNAVSQEVELLGGFDPSTAVRVDKLGLHLGFTRATG